MGPEMKKRNRVLWIDEGWQPLLIGYCPTVKAWQKALRAHDGAIADAPPNTAGWVTYCPATGSHLSAVYVCIPKPSADPVQTIGIMAHEAQHVLQYVLGEMGERNPGNEFMAYGLQCILQNLIKAATTAHPKDYWIGK